MKKKQSLTHLLFCPGPVNVKDNVKEAAVKNEIGHREKEFSVLLESINDKLLSLFKVKDLGVFKSVILTGSGTAANESVLSSIVGNRHILVLANGEFGERLYEISSIHNKNTHILKFGWGEKIDIKKVEQYLIKRKVDIIAMVHHETSTGMLNPIEQIGSLARRFKTLFFTDMISSAGAEKVDLEKYNITFCSGSAAKAISSLPGVSFVIGKRTEFEKLKTIPVKTSYLNLYKFYHYSTQFQQTPNTPAVQLFYALEQALDNILLEGVEARISHLKERAKMFREGLKHLGLKFLINEKDMSSVLTTIMTPSNITIGQLKERLHERKIIVYNGKGPIANKVFQVGNIGDVNKEDITFFLSALKEVIVQ